MQVAIGAVAIINRVPDVFVMVSPHIFTLHSCLLEQSALDINSTHLYYFYFVDVYTY